LVHREKAFIDNIKRTNQILALRLDAVCDYEIERSNENSTTLEWSVLLKMQWNGNFGLEKKKSIEKVIIQDCQVPQFELATPKNERCLER